MGAEGVRAVVLAAGTASRFGSPKVLAHLDGKPLLERVLAALAAAGIEHAVVVLGAAADDVEAAVDWPAGTTRVRNPRPADGLASSLRLGVAAARALHDEEPAALVIALGDQPLVDPATVRGLLAAASDDRPVAVPRYPDGRNPNPVVVGAAAFHLVESATGDRGLGPLLAAHPALVVEVPASVDNPDVDTPADLERIRTAPGRVP